MALDLLSWFGSEEDEEDGKVLELADPKVGNSWPKRGFRCKNPPLTEGFSGRSDGSAFQPDDEEEFLLIKFGCT